MIKKIISIIRKQGIAGLVKVILLRLNIKKSEHYLMIKEIVSAGNGIEIGGKSSAFDAQGILPVYSYIKNLDNCNFSSKTVWEGKIKTGLSYYYDKSHEPGRQFILEATKLQEIKDESYDFLLSSHVIEHTANPIKALKEWIRVIKPNGHLIVLIPHKDGTFDHRRPITNLEHMIQDYETEVGEKDSTHVEEILKLHDLSMDLEAGTHMQFSERSLHNYENRCLHHHVFNTHLAVCLFDYLKLNIKAVEAISPMHILIVAQKPELFDGRGNADLIDYVSSDKFKTPFISDRL